MKTLLAALAVAVLASGCVVAPTPYYAQTYYEQPRVVYVAPQPMVYTPPFYGSIVVGGYHRR